MITIADRAILTIMCALVTMFACSAASANDACVFSAPGPTEKLYQMHNDGSVFVRNENACTSPSCFGGWFLLDENANTASIAAYCELYQMHKDGSIFYYTGNRTDQCTGGICVNWQQLDAHPHTKSIAVGAPYSLPMVY